MTWPRPVARPVAIPLDAHYIETAFARRLRAVLDVALADRSGHVVGARSGAGKSTELEEFAARHPVVRHLDGQTRVPIVRATPPVGPRSSTKGFTRSLVESFGTVPRGTQEAQLAWLIGQMVACESGLIVVDDAHGVTADDLLLVKHVTDEVARRRGGERVGFVLLCAAAGGTLPLAEIINRPTLQWVQLRRRMSPVRPWIYVASLSPAEVRDALAAYESVVLAPHLPDLRLVRWSERISRHLAHPFFDIEGNGRATMQNARDVVDGIVRRLLVNGLGDIPDESLVDEAVAELLAAPTTQVIESDPGPATIEDDPASDTRTLDDRMVVQGAVG